MVLAAMMAKDRDALLCDLAETYHIYDFASVPVRTLAILAAGLREGSRIRTEMAGMHEVQAEIVLVRIHDILQKVFMEEPFLLSDVVTGREQQRQKIKEETTFDTPEAFFEAYYGKRKRK